MLKGKLPRILVVGWVGIGIGLAYADDVSVVALARSKEAVPVTAEPLLARELLRQSVLIAARDEIGATTRDAVLEESPPTDAVALKPELLASIPEGPGHNHATLSFKLFAPDGKSIVELTPDHKTWHDHLEIALGVAEALSREEFPKALRGLHVTGQTHAADPVGEISTAAAQRLETLEITAQFAAVRLLHAEIRDHGASPKRLSALARAYANLSQLTALVWGASPKVFAARAMLYGQRGTALFPNNPDALWGRGYALAVIGLPKQGLDDFDAVAALPNAPKPPYWVELARYFGRYDTASLTTAASDNPDHAALADFFAMLTVAHCGLNSAPVMLSQLLLQKQPDCLRAIAIINAHSGPGLGNWSSHAIGGLFAGTLANLPQTFSDLPADIPVPTADGISPDVAPTEAILRKAGANDRGEPSFNALAGLIENVDFLSAQMSAYHVAFKWGQSPADEVDAVWPRLKNHRYAAVLDALRGVQNGGQGGTAPFYEAAQNIRLEDPTFAMRPFSQVFDNLGAAMSQRNGFLIENQVEDQTAAGIDTYLEAYNFGYGGRDPRGMKWMAEQLEPIAPDSPARLTTQIYTEWDKAEPKLADWLKANGDYPAVTLAAARHYQASDPAKAIDFYNRCIAVSPDVGVYRDLAGVYRRQGDDKNWVATMTSALKAPSLGLEQARVQVDLSEYYIAHDDLKTAREYAEDAADTHAEWAMLAAANVETRMGEWDDAEGWIKQASMQYGDESLWLAWCVSTGHGDLATASDRAGAYADQLALRDDYDSQALRLRIQLLLQHDDDAAQSADALFSTTSDPWAGLVRMSLALKKKDLAAAKAAAQEAAKKGTKFRFDDRVPRVALIRCAKMLAEALDKSTPPERKTIAAAAAGQSFDGDAVNYFSGQVYQFLNHDDEARSSYDACAKSSPWRADSALACRAKREMDEKK